ncbi:DUF6268 family outer membrane beta-barrel protein [Pontibacter sp. HSC-36F09]|uniref:DUF6268 family outer membrane beta-barrel protein n=1 Tax=Pontibacter sp. HSC-36F09 TaxID=2910966 RepID=UPI00209EFA64|nr:DUF6268 family outer membrane beta-barrel protein [Pontibacter sp. HSC-36F09]MCP2042683.1 hypothetical protein [Pontibacter sp. HSC-36F09]
MKLTLPKLLLIPLLLLGERALAQETEQDLTDVQKQTKEYASPGVRGMGKSRGIVIGYERLPQFDMESESDNPEVGNGRARVRRHNKFFVRALAPVMNKPNTKLILGIDHKFEEFNFESVSPASYSLYRNLEDKNLKSLGLQLAFLHSFDEVRFLLVRAKGELNGDYTRDNINVSDYLKTTIDVGYGWKRSPDFAWGVGFQLGYTFGRQRLYPGIIYNRTFNDRWGVESIFPANLRVRYNVSEKTLLYTGYRIEGASYNLYASEPPLSQFNDIELRRTDIKGLLRLEQEIYDFLWFAVEGGFRQYYRHRAFDDVGSRDVLIKNTLKGAGYVGIELYAVPPRKLLERSQNR